MKTKEILLDASTVTSALTVLAALPYEKDLVQVFPPSWTGTIAIVGVIATLLLRIIASRLAR